MIDKAKYYNLISKHTIKKWDACQGNRTYSRIDRTGCQIK